LSEKGDSFLRPLKNKGFRKERMMKVRLDALGKSRTLESNKSRHGNGHDQFGGGCDPFSRNLE
jgi:hypothetical protein